MDTTLVQIGHKQVMKMVTSRVTNYKQRLVASMFARISYAHTQLWKHGHEDHEGIHCLCCKDVVLVQYQIVVSMPNWYQVVFCSGIHVIVCRRDPCCWDHDRRSIPAWSMQYWRPPRMGQLLY